MDLSLGYRPLRRYSAAHASAARRRLLVGGFGTGKTMALCGDAITRGLAVPGARILMSRFTVPEVRDTLEPVFLDVLPHELFLASDVKRGGGHIESITLPNGTKFLFRAIDDWRKHKSLNLALWYCDELSEFDAETFNGMVARTRQVELTSEARAMGYTHSIPDGFRGFMGATNPAGHDWMWRDWVDTPKPETAYWTATSLDNPHLPEDYLSALLEMPDAWVKRYVFANFDEFGGQIYPEWGWESHVWHAPLEVTRATPAWMALDPGTRHPTAVLWVVVHGDKVIGVAEHMEAQWDVDQHVEVFRRIEAKLPPIQWRVADPNSIHVRDRGTQMSLHRQYARKGYVFRDGPSRHRDRIPMLGTLIKSKRFMVTRNCPRAFEQIGGYRWEDLTPAMKRRLGSENEEYGPERPVTANDDLVDCAQYLSSRWVRPPKPAPVADERSAHRRMSEEAHAEIARKLQRRREGALDSSHELGVNL